MIDDYGNECRGEVERLRAALAEMTEYNDELTEQNSRLAARWLNALGDPGSPEELDKAIVEIPKLRARVAELEAFKASVPWGALILISALLEPDLMRRISYETRTTVKGQLDDWIDSHAPKEPPHALKEAAE